MPNHGGELCFVVQQFDQSRMNNDDAIGCGKSVSLVIQHDVELKRNPTRIINSEVGLICGNQAPPNRRNVVLHSLIRQELELPDLSIFNSPGLSASRGLHARVQRLPQFGLAILEIVVAELYTLGQDPSGLAVPLPLIGH